MNFKILNAIGPVYTEAARALLREMGEITDFTGSQEEFEMVMGDYDVLVIGLNYRVNKKALSSAKKLRFIVTATTGLDHVDLVAAKDRSIEVLSLRGEDEFLNTISGTAELAFGLILSLARFIPHSFQSVLSGKWDREKFRGHNLSGKTLGIVGLGRLGKMVARYGVAFGMRVIYSDPHVSVPANLSCERVEFTNLIESSDFISLHVHLSPQTKWLINREALEKIKFSSYLINTSRGDIVDEKAVLEALKSGRLAGYGADVLAGELDFSNQTFSSYPLVDFAKNHSNVVIVPHIGGMTFESREHTDIFMAKKLKKHLQTLKPN